VTFTIGIGQYGGGVDGNLAGEGLRCKLAVAVDMDMADAEDVPKLSGSRARDPALMIPIATAATMTPIRPV